MKEAGLSIAETKTDMVRTRLARRLRALRVPDYESYCQLVEGPDGVEEMGLMISALTTNVSHFFRESHHFELMKREILPDLIQRSEGPIRIWSAGCANGQEPYSIAMTLAEAGITKDRDARILATDIDPNVVSFAKAAEYPRHMLGGLSAERLARFMRPKRDDLFCAAPEIRALVAFRVLNLLRPWPMTGRFDAVFCRNVVIYFDGPTQAQLWDRFAQILKPGGWMFLGHSERVDSHAEGYFKKAQVTAYRRTDMPYAPNRGIT
jgi:chemotaxis protein methyltransferase CheR